jgi:hypothetical protein
MDKEQLRLQMLSGIITEGEYRIKLEELSQNTEKDSLNEHYVAGGIVGIGAINNPFEGRVKESYEDAFEHFLGERYLNKFENREQDLEEDKDPDVYESKDDIPEAPSHEETDANQVYEAEVNENVGATIDKILKAFEFSQAGNDEMIELANYLLSPEGPRNIAMQLKSSLKGEGGENYFTSNPEELDALLSKLREDKKPGTAKERSEMAKKARAGKDIGEKGKNFEKIAKSASKKYGSEEAGKKVAGAVMYGKLNK